jgi:hypothetical protein
MVPVVAVVVQLVWVSAVLVCADVRAEIVDEMGPVTCVSSVVDVSASIRFSLLPRLSGKSSSRAKGEAVRALEELFTRLRCRRGRESHCISGRLPR